jgi:predicted nuclease of predicted toxin-antitoxin system
VRLLVDNQLPVALAQWLVAQGADAVHILNLDLDSLPDTGIWAHAAAENRIVISKDEDFFLLANRDGDTGRLLWVRIGNCRNAALLARFAADWSSIQQAFASGQRIVELR